MTATSPSTDLRSFAKNYTSQCGEDGILEQIFSVIGDADRWCVEFGAWDGEHLSNTFHLIEAHGWSGVLIEGDAGRFGQLRKRFEDVKRVVPVHRYVRFEGQDGLDNILATTSLPPDFSLLSIDIDGNDYHVWEALRAYRPRVVVIEFNPTIPNDIDFVQPRNERVSQGSSLRALVRLADSKGYVLLVTTDWNAIFVRADLAEPFAVGGRSIDEVHDDRKYQMLLFQLFDGTLVLDGCRQMLWHGATVPPRGLQVVPAFLRTYVPQMSRWQRVAWRLLRRVTGLERPS